nr:EAL domain-containing protein [Vibrio eleionomae]
MGDSQKIIKYSYIARQPILDQNKCTVGYELLFRDGPNNSFPDIDPETATSRLLSDHFLSNHYQTLGENFGFVNFPYQSLINLIPTLFPSHSLVIEVLETCEPSDELLSAIKHMRKQGYKIALDDFIPNQAWKPFIPYISVIKFDLRAISIAKAKIFMDRVKGYDIEFLAEKVETYDEFQQAKAAGFTLFQGYFFSQPEVLQRKSLNPTFLTLVQLCKEISKENLDYKKLEEIITKDLSVSFKLLSFVNASASVSSKIQNFKQALVYLGEQKLRRFVSIVAIASTQDDKPNALYTLSIQRARFCELLWQRARVKCNNFDLEDGAAFLTGMFSLLDSLLDQPLDNIVEQIPIDEALKQALLKKTGILGNILTLVQSYEHADWDVVARQSKVLQLSEKDVIKSYDDAIEWADVMMDMQL